jgi:hypothetical protein
MNEVISLAEPRCPVSVGLKASIHAPRSEVVSPTQGCAGVSESMDAPRLVCAPPNTSNTPECPVETGSSQAPINAVEEPESSGNTPPTTPTPPRLTGGLRASIHAPPDPSAVALQVLCDNTEKLGKESAHSMTRSSPTDIGLNASIHAPARCPPSLPAQRSSKHHTDVPNWAAISKAQNSESSTASGGISSHALRGNSPDPTLDVPTTTMRCAARGQEGRGSVDSSDGFLIYSVDDQEESSTSTTGSGETDQDSTLGDDTEADDPNEQDNDFFTQPSSRRARRRGRPWRPRQKVPYVPPPRMRNLTVVDANSLAYPPTSLGVHQPYTNAPPPPPLPHHPTSPSGPMMISPNGIMHDQYGRPGYRYHHSSPPHMVAPIPGFQPPCPQFYPHPLHVSPQAPSTPLYGR